MIRRSLADPPLFSLAHEERGHLTLREARGPAAVHIFVLEDDIIRVAVLADGDWKAPRTWTIAPGAEDVDAEGRAWEDMSGFSCPSYSKATVDGKLVIETARLRLSVKLAGFLCRWEMRRGGDWVRIARDRATQAYDFGWWDERVQHYLARSPSEKYFGLGECSGDMDRAGRRIRLSNTDALGYSARTSDPLYKHIPFVITHHAQTNAAFGLFYDTMSDCTFDFGCERSHYHGLFRSFTAEHGDLDYYVIAGPTVADVTRRFTWLTGRPAFMPKWSLGYSGSTMSYTDAPEAQALMNAFLAKCAEHDILCESFHLSSGYTSIGDKRHVFHWNREKFPDPAAFVAQYAAHGVKLIPNIKPCLLSDHPHYAEAAREEYFIAKGLGAPLLVQFWGSLGSYIDFTNPGAVAWWKARVTEALLDTGMAGTWNDNNEFEIRELTSRAREAKPLQSLLMVRASREAQVAHAPDKRPFLVTRAGFAGMQRYAQTWSGDNATSWETLKYNIKMGLGLALSGVSNTGHDVGGFTGPAPDAELFLRWVEFGIFMPRFSIHSWNDDGTVNEPWMHPEITHHVRDLIKLRARLTPYLYNLIWDSHCTFAPMVRPTLYDFPDDDRTLAESDEMMLGPSLLVAPVVEPGQKRRSLYLPRGADWYDFWTGEIYSGGNDVAVPAEWGRPPLFARAGGAIAANFAEQHFAKSADQRAFYVFAPRGQGSFETSSFEDDGETDGYKRGQFATWTVGVDATATEVHVGATRSGLFSAAPKEVMLAFPASERRPIRAKAGRIAGAAQTGNGRVVTVVLA